jgi:hypothetical protein
MIISVDRVNPDDTILILEAKTGILYEAQCGGMMCEHPKFEGFVLCLGNFMQDFDDCSYGCDHIQDLPEKRDQLANDLNDLLQSETDRWRYSIVFDFERIDQLKEGWWPVIVTGVIDDWNDTAGRFRGIIHTGNCD